MATDPNSDESPSSFWVHRSAEEVAAAVGSGVVFDPHELVMPTFWESDEELNAFIADVYASRTSA